MSALSAEAVKSGLLPEHLVDPISGFKFALRKWILCNNILAYKQQITLIGEKIDVFPYLDCKRARWKYARLH